MLTDTVIEDDRWQGADLSALAEQGARAALLHLGIDPQGFEIAVLGCDDARIQELNADFREKPTPTNVLSWPTQERGPEIAGEMPDLPQAEPGPFAQELGDIAISYDTCQAEASTADRPFSAHVTHLIVHATLHLLGFDHIRDQDATLMEGLEVEILGKLGLPDPYS